MSRFSKKNSAESEEPTSSDYIYRTIKILYYLTSLIVLPVVFLLLVPWMLIKKIWTMDRLGILPEDRRKPFLGGIWLHGASVGEVNVLLPLIHEYMQTTNVRLMITTMTMSGQKYVLEKCENYKDRIYVMLMPLDFWPFWNFVLRQTKPQKIVIAETELWPAFYFEASRANIPLVIVNGRISDKSYQNYLIFHYIFGAILKCTNRIYAQTDTDRNRFIEIGAAAENTVIAGNLKNDGLTQWLNAKVEPLEFYPDAKRVVFGSLRPKEAEFLIEFITLANEKQLPLKIIIAPRHFDWLNTLYDLLNQKNITYQVVTKSGFVPKDQNVQVLIVDKIGFLQKGYKGALLAFVGGTLYPEYGGHNALEPASLGVPVFHGQYFAEQASNTNALLKGGASKIIYSPNELITEAQKLLSSPQDYQALAAKCIEVVTKEAGTIAQLRKDSFFDIDK